MSNKSTDGYVGGPTLGFGPLDFVQSLDMMCGTGTGTGAGMAGHGKHGIADGGAVLIIGSSSELFEWK